MKVFGILLFLLIFSAAQTVFAQTASKTGTVAPNPDKNKKENDFENAETLATDFGNFTYLDLNNKEIKLTNGIYLYTNPKTKLTHNYKFRKVYYFDVTGDRQNDAIVQLYADFCETCEMRSIFYLYSAQNKKLVPIWKIATGKGANCGLKDVSFAVSGIVLETFGKCDLKDWLIFEDNPLNKIDIATKFTFEYKDGTFTPILKENFAFPLTEIINHRTKIKFGN